MGDPRRRSDGLLSRPATWTAAIVLAARVAGGGADAPAGAVEPSPAERPSGAPAAVAAPAVGAPGAVVDRLACAADAAETYALYLPRAYDPARRWPVLYVMDPRGNALVALERFRAGAERVGVIVVSSWNTESDGPPGPNARAMNALLADTRDRLAIDGRRLYLAGFSGTARVGWEFAERLRGAVAGLVGFGAGWPPGFEPDPDPPYVFFGGAGTADFNFEEVRLLGARLDRAGVRRHLEFYDGPHAWPPAEVCGAALDWMEVQAMRQGLRSRDDTAIARLLADRLGRAREHESRGRLPEAFEEFRAIAADYADLADVSEARAAAGRLARNGKVRRAIAAEGRTIARRREFDGAVAEWAEALRAPSPPPSPGDTLTRLRVASLQRRAVAGDQAARRLLEYLFVEAAFYEPRDLLARDRPDRALLALEVADAVRPGRPFVLVGMARALARMGNVPAALAALRRAAATGGIEAAALETDPDLAPLRDQPGFAAILESLRGRTPS